MSILTYVSRKSHIKPIPLHFSHTKIKCLKTVQKLYIFSVISILSKIWLFQHWKIQFLDLKSLFWTKSLDFLAKFAPKRNFWIILVLCSGPTTQIDFAPKRYITLCNLSSQKTLKKYIRFLEKIHRHTPPKD